jgi:2Fe-2S ferredoxin
MPIIQITQKDGSEVLLDVAVGQTIMQAAHECAVSGIIGECGGAAMCGTCHVFVNAANLDDLPVMNQNENELLDCTATPRQPNSRLSCQIRMTEKLTGLKLTLPEQQLF